MKKFSWLIQSVIIATVVTGYFAFAQYVNPFGFWQEADPVKIMGNGYESSQNRSTANLAGGASWCGTWERVWFFPSAMSYTKSDVAGELFMEFCKDGSCATACVAGEADSSLQYNISANIPEVHRLSVTRPFFRLRYVNGSSAQGSFQIGAIYGEHENLAAPLNLSQGLDADAINTRPTIFSDEVVRGKRPGVKHFTKFGHRTGLTAANGEETVWETSGNFTPMTSADTFDIAYNNTTDGLGQNGALTLFIQYIDANGLDAEATHTLSNTGSDTTSFTGLGINRVAVASSGTSQMNTNAITVTDTGGGTTQAIVPALQSVTQQAIYHTATNADAVTKFLWVNVNKLSGGAAPVVLIKGYVFNRTAETRYEIFRELIDTSVENTVSINEPVGFGLSPGDVLYFVADTDRDSTEVTLRFSLIEYQRE